MKTKWRQSFCTKNATVIIEKTARRFSAVHPVSHSYVKSLVAKFKKDVPLVGRSSVNNEDIQIEVLREFGMQSKQFIRSVSDTIGYSKSTIHEFYGENDNQPNFVFRVCFSDEQNVFPMLLSTATIVITGQTTTPTGLKKPICSIPKSSESGPG